MDKRSAWASRPPAKPFCNRISVRADSLLSLAKANPMFTNRGYSTAGIPSQLHNEIISFEAMAVTQAERQQREHVLQQIKDAVAASFAGMKPIFAEAIQVAGLTYTSSRGS